MNLVVNASESGDSLRVPLLIPGLSRSGSDQWLLQRYAQPLLWEVKDFNDTQKNTAGEKWYRTTLRLETYLLIPVPQLQKKRIEKTSLRGPIQASGHRHFISLRG